MGMPEVNLRRTLTSLHYSKCSTEVYNFVDASKVAMAAVACLRLAEKESETTETYFLIGKIKFAPTKQTSVPKLELEAAVIGVRFHSTILKESSLIVDKSVFWTDSQVVLDWNASCKKHIVYDAIQIRKISPPTEVIRWKHVRTSHNPADHGTR